MRCVFFFLQFFLFLVDTLVSAANDFPRTPSPYLAAATVAFERVYHLHSLRFARRVSQL